MAPVVGGPAGRAERPRGREDAGGRGSGREACGVPEGVGGSETEAMRAAASVARHQREVSALCTGEGGEGGGRGEGRELEVRDAGAWGGCLVWAGSARPWVWAREGADGGARRGGGGKVWERGGEGW